MFIHAYWKSNTGVSLKTSKAMLGKIKSVMEMDRMNVFFG